MSEKRFILKIDRTLEIIDKKENHRIRDMYKSCEVLNELEKENEQLKRQLLYNGDDVCSICKHEYLTPSGDYFIGKCKKGHEECSKKDIKYCEDFELIQVDFEDLIKRMDKELKDK